MKTRKRLLAAILLICALLTVCFLFSGCEKTGTCDSCGQEDKLNKFVDSSGEVYWYCDFCNNLAKIADAF